MHLIESLESRRLFASFTAGSVADLIADINAANAAGGPNTITLAPGTTFKLNAVNNDFGTPTGLPVIAAGNELTIVGNGDTIQRSTATATPAFRLFGVASGGSLTLNNLTLSNGLAFHPSIMTWGAGGAIASAGTLSLTGVTIQNCIAQGQTAYPAFGGGIYSNGALTIADSAILNNQALGGNGSDSVSLPNSGGGAFGGGLYVAGGTAILTNTAVSSNVARGGDGAKGGSVRGKEGSWQWGGGAGGDGLGGGIYIAANTSGTIRGTTINQNAARGGTGGSSPKGLPKGPDGVGRGGGIYIAPGALVSLDALTQASTNNNSASTRDNDIFGSYITIP